MPLAAAAPLVESWAIHNRIHLYLLDAISPAGFAAKAGGKGRAVGTALAHVHNVRLMWLKSAAPELLAPLKKFESDTTPTADEVRSALVASGSAIAELVTSAVADGGRVKGFKPHVTAFVGYLIAHEAHHRGQITLALRLAGEPLEKTVAYGLWEWGSR